MILKENISAQKLRGAYYTPDELARLMIRLVCSRDYKCILEPSCGDGVFIDKVMDAHILTDDATITAVEIEPDEAEKVKSRYASSNKVHINQEDFFDFYERVLGKENYDLIVGNPPYIRYQYLTETQREIQSKILTSHGMKSNKLINAWVAFLVACVQLLEDDGRIAFVIPAEILQVAYAEDLRLYLANNLSSITLIAFKQRVFPEIEQEVLVLIGTKANRKEGIRIIEIADLAELASLDLQTVGYNSIQHVKEKWTKYFMTSDEMDVIRQIRNDYRFSKFADFGLINVGITTGNNKYFSVDKNTVSKYALDYISKPLIGRSSHAHGIYFTNEDWHKNIEQGKRAYLVDFPNIPIEEYPPKHREYIKYGETSGENTGYKCSIRDRWYIVPSVWIPDAFFLRRNNLYPKFVINRCEAVSTDTMHRMKFNEGVNPNYVLLSYYNSISFAFTEICGRSYGGGVLEILPREMGNIMLPVIEKIDSLLEIELLEYIDSIVRSDDDIEKALDAVDKKLLITQLRIPVEWCVSCRNIWKKLQRRRLSRS